MPGRARDAWERALDAQRGLLDEVKPGVMDEGDRWAKSARTPSPAVRGHGPAHRAQQVGLVIGIINKVGEWRAGRLGAARRRPRRAAATAARARAAWWRPGAAPQGEARLDLRPVRQVRDVRIAREHARARLAGGGSPPPPLSRLVAARGLRAQAPPPGPRLPNPRYAFAEFGDASSAPRSRSTAPRSRTTACAARSRAAAAERWPDARAARGSSGPPWAALARALVVNMGVHRTSDVGPAHLSTRRVYFIPGVLGYSSILLDGDGGRGEGGTGRRRRRRCSGDHRPITGRRASHAARRHPP